MHKKKDPRAADTAPGEVRVQMKPALILVHHQPSDELTALADSPPPWLAEAAVIDQLHHLLVVDDARRHGLTDPDTEDREVSR